MQHHNAVVGLVTERSRSRLMTAAPQAAICATCLDVERHLRHARSSALIVDPGVSGVTVDWLRGVRADFPSVAVLIYGELDPFSFATLAELARNGFADVVLRGYDDGPARFAHVIEDAVARLRQRCGLDGLVERLAGVPQPLRAAVSQMFLYPQRYHSTNDLARTALMSTRAVFRHMEAAAVTSTRRLVAAARVWRAYHELNGSGKTASAVAARLRYASPDQMCAHFVELTGYTPADVKKGVSETEFSERLLASIFDVTKAEELQPTEVSV
jgi:AraC-like DNA-binding protein